MPDRSKNSLLEAIKQLTSNIPKETFKTFTTDRGKEFS
jgi:transposase insI for insertion sequence element IS30B/C/D